MKEHCLCSTGNLADCAANLSLLMQANGYMPDKVTARKATRRAAAVLSELGVSVQPPVPIHSLVLASLFILWRHTCTYTI
jgi:hypothetical protein